MSPRRVGGGGLPYRVQVGAVVGQPLDDEDFEDEDDDDVPVS